MSVEIVKVTCQECDKVFEEKKTWHGQSEICKECVKNRKRQVCKRHSKQLKNYEIVSSKECVFCKVENIF